MVSGAVWQIPNSFVSNRRNDRTLKGPEEIRDFERRQIWKLFYQLSNLSFRVDIMAEKQNEMGKSNIPCSRLWGWRGQLHDCSRDR